MRVQTELGPQLHYVGVDERGVELHIIAVPDARRPGGLVVIHAMPTSYGGRDTDRGKPVAGAQGEDLPADSEGGAS